MPSSPTRSVRADRAVSRRIPALILCLITDRRRLAASLDLPIESALPALLEQIAGAVAAEVDIIQVRERDLDGRQYARLVRECLRLTTGSPTKVLVNDRLDVALAAGAHGVHLREASIAIADARRVAARAITIGRSVHDAAGAEAGRSADYLIAGSVFVTASKAGAAPSLGLAGLRSVVDAAGDCPVWAIGGITPQNAGDVRRCGVRGVAAIGAFIPTDTARQLGHRVEKLARRLRFSFDTPGRLP